MYGNKWREKAYGVKVAAGFQCEFIYRDGSRCGRRSFLEAHHVTYERLRRERPSDLLCLCRLHHMKVHGRLPNAG